MPISFEMPDSDVKEKVRRSSGPDPTRQTAATFVRDARKLQTMPAPKTQTTRHDDIHIPAAALAKLHKEQERMQRERGDQKSDHDMSAEAIDNAFKAPGVWTVFGDMPKKAEKPFHPRLNVVAAGADGKAGKALLESLGCAMHNTKGLKGPTDNKIGQDNCSVSHIAGGFNLFCVFDGHGEGGHWPSYRAAKTLPYLLQTSPTLTKMMKRGEVGAALVLAFEVLQKDLEDQATADKIDLMVAGSTAAVIVQKPREKKVWIGTTGDSRVMMVAPGKGLIQQTIDHKFNVPAERERVERMGCELEITEHEDGFIEERLNIKGEDYPGICMTRSLGDLIVKPYGVIPEPEIWEWDVSSCPDALVLAASDGVWEFMETEEVADFVLQSLASGVSREDTVKALIKEAQGKWEEMEDGYCDDITAILMPVLADCGGAGGGGGSSDTPCCEGKCAIQ